MRRFVFVIHPRIVIQSVECQPFSSRYHPSQSWRNESTWSFETHIFIRLAFPNRSFIRRNAAFTRRLTERASLNSSIWPASLGKDIVVRGEVDFVFLPPHPPRTPTVVVLFTEWNEKEGEKRRRRMRKSSYITSPPSHVEWPKCRAQFNLIANAAWTIEEDDLRLNLRICFLVVIPTSSTFSSLWVHFLWHIPPASQKADEEEEEKEAGWSSNIVRLLILNRLWEFRRGHCRSFLGFMKRQVSYSFTSHLARLDGK